MQERKSEGEDDYIVCFLYDEDCLESTCVGVVSGERFCTIDEESFNFGSHGRVTFEIKAGFICLQENSTDTLQPPCFDKTNIPKYK